MQVSSSVHRSLAGRRPRGTWAHPCHVRVGGETRQLEVGPRENRPRTFQSVPTATTAALTDGGFFRHHNWSRRCNQMAYNLLQLLIPARFLLTFGHLIPTLMMILTRKENIMAALPADPSDGQIKRAKDEVIPILRAPQPFLPSYSLF